VVKLHYTNHSKMIPTSFIQCQLETLTAVFLKFVIRDVARVNC